MIWKGYNVWNELKKISAQKEDNYFSPWSYDNKELTSHIRK
jgi:hypothetical protein